MEEWKEYKLGDICKSIADGDHMPPPKSDRGIPFVTISNIVDNRLDFGNTHYVPQSYYDGLDDKRRPYIGDTIYSVVGTFGKPVYVNEDKPFVFQRHIAILRPDESKIVPQFLFYSLLSPEFYRKADMMAVGAVQRTISLTSLRKSTIHIPSINIQSKIVNILSSLDDKIAVNKKICENLEAQAQALFKHWFVDFAPFKEGKFVESELGKIPLSEICEQITDGVHNSVKDEPNSNYMLLSCKNIVGGVLSKNNYRSISKNTFDSLRLRTKLAKGDILISSVGTIGEIAIVEDDPLNYEFQRSVAIVKPKEKIGTYFLYNALLASKLRLQHAAHGAVQQCLFLGDLKKFEVNYYDIEKAFLYNETVKPLFEEIAKLHQESDCLSTLRDTLLPKLMSGQIKV